MALDLTGISNENEFYTSHYLAAILEDDLKDLFATWAKAEEEGKGKPPADLLLSLSRDYARLRSDLARERDAASRLDLQCPFLASFLAALGYTLAPTVKELGDGSAIPVLAEVTKKNGAPDLWVLETVETAEADAGAADPLSQPFLPEQLPPPEPGAEPLRLPSDGGEPLSLDDVLTDAVFALPEPPRWVIALNHGLVVLADRTKWTQKRYLRFDLAEIYGRRSPGTFRALAALLHRESLAPEGGLSLLDTLDESSHKHAFAVSDSLKYSVREAVELLGNEALYDLRERLREGVYGREMAKPLTEECLRYLYRLLFCFYVEARPELGYAPMKSEEYRTGYSLEALRDLELQDLTTEESKNGYFLNDSVATLFRLVYEGFSHEEKQTVLGADQGTDRHTFRMEPLRSHLFDPERTPLLNRVRFRNHVLQKVLECLSLSRPKRSGRGGAKKRGRISYAQLGINQLGAVYEGLLSYTGFFAEEDLYEVHRAGETPDELQNAWFVKAADLAKYTDEEKLFDGRLRKYGKGTYIYRLSGRNREKSASYYTPEVLTRCVVKYALKELLKDRTADDILSLTICEPALGSGAFANEAVNQLAEAYLERKQAELKRSIPHDALLLEKQKIKAYLADNNVHGVDLNPTAVELAEISLWLNTIYAGHTIPWFGNQLVAGNSLVGARRQVFTPKDAPRKGGHFVFEGVPDRVKLGEARPEGAVYHFLAPDPGMCDYDDKVIRELAPDEIKAIKEWKKEFGQPFSASELKTLQKLSSAIDRLWQKHVEERRKLRADTRNTFPVFGHESDPAFAPPESGKRLSTRDKDRLYRQRFLADGVRASSPYRRLRTAMDYWCALWFWPIEKASLLPSREEFLLDLAVLLEGTSQGVALVGGADQTTLFPDDTPKQEALKLVDEFGFVDVDKLTREMPRLAAVKELAERHRFLHWELEFAEVFADRGGFDLIVGNPPWIRVEWNDAGIIGDFEPLFVLRVRTASKLAELRREATTAFVGLREAYLQEFVESCGTQRFLNAEQNFPLLKGTQSNLYKCFLPQAWMAMNRGGAAGFLHPDGVYDDPKGGALRGALFTRLRYHFRFENELHLFSDVHNNVASFSVNCYGAASSSPQFIDISNLFTPSTVDACIESNVSGSHSDPLQSHLSLRASSPVPGIKDLAGRWCVEGHPSRAIRVGLVELDEPPRLSRRPQRLRGWGHGKTRKVPRRGEGEGGAARIRAGAVA
ncbi:MAG: Eco57I restriction-modification methylase domain-containing protein, partial [Thermoanaerobaculia bacterium]